MVVLFILSIQKGGSVRWAPGRRRGRFRDNDVLSLRSFSGVAGHHLLCGFGGAHPVHFPFRASRLRRGRRAPILPSSGTTPTSSLCAFDFSSGIKEFLLESVWLLLLLMRRPLLSSWLLLFRVSPTRPFSSSRFAGLIIGPVSVLALLLFRLRILPRRARPAVLLLAHLTVSTSHTNSSPLFLPFILLFCTRARSRFKVLRLVF